MVIDDRVPKCPSEFEWCTEPPALNPDPAVNK